MSEQMVHEAVNSARGQALRYQRAEHAEIAPVDLTDLEDGRVLVETLYSGISRGTEGLVYHGKIPPSAFADMRCPHQQGDFTFPVAYGYSCVGKVVAAANDMHQHLVDKHVFVLHPHQNLFVVSAESCAILPAELSAERAVLGANMETALNAFWDSETASDQKTCVIGAGVVGLLTARLILQETGVAPVVVDVDPAKETVCDKLNLPFTLPNTLTGDFDRMFHTSANPAGLQTAIDHAAFEARIIEMSWYGDKPVTLQLGSHFHMRRLTIQSSQVGHVSPAYRADVSYQERMTMALERLCDPVFDCLLEPAIDFQALPAHLPDIFKAGTTRLCQLIRY